MCICNYIVLYLTKYNSFYVYKTFYFFLDTIQEQNVSRKYIQSI